ncbi:MAG TPA: hypothetical protein PKY30_12280 [Myxococcota bacterium]|nr:hypothetical protein [Myxococcota bacterium]
MPTNEQPLLSREQRILRELPVVLPKLLALEVTDFSELRSRVRGLPAMFLRNGPVQVLLYLSGKAEDKPGPKALLEAYFHLLSELGSPSSALREFAAKAKKKSPTRAEWLALFKETAARSVEEHLYDQALCAELATWLARALETEFQLRKPENKL